MYKTNAEIKLEIAVNALEEHMEALGRELDKIEITTVWDAKLKFAAIQGVLNYMKKDND
jgi:hypothetical protein